MNSSAQKIQEETSENIEQDIIEEKKDNTLSVGSILKSTRQKRGFSLDAVHEATKVPLDILKAMEEGYTVRTLSSFYYKGFLKIYAKYLELNLSDFIDQYEEPKDLYPPIIVKPRLKQESLRDKCAKFFTKERKQKIVILVGGFFSLLIIFKFFYFIANLKPKVDNQKPDSVISDTNKNQGIEDDNGRASIEKSKKSDQKDIPPGTIASGLTNKAKNPDKEKPPVRIKNQNVPPPKKVSSLQNNVPVKKVNVEQIVQPIESVKAPPIPVALKDVTLTVRAKKKSWLRVKVDDVVVFQSTLAAGVVETWMADKTIEISGKNINQLEFEVNGKMIGTLGRKGRKAKGLVVTKEGLFVTK